MTVHDGDLPRKSDRFVMKLQHAPQSVHTTHTDHYAHNLTAPTSPWAIASYALVVAALVSASVSVLCSFIASALAMLCGAFAIATIVSRRQTAGIWMAILAIAAATLPFVITAITLLAR